MERTFELRLTGERGGRSFAAVGSISEDRVRVGAPRSTAGRRRSSEGEEAFATRILPTESTEETYLE